MTIINFRLLSVIFLMYQGKSPREDGFNPGFCKKYWAIMGGDVTKACLKWRDNCMLSVGLNNTNLVLIIKKEFAETIKDLRLIVLCNVIYKIVAKMLANRLKMVLP